MNINVQSVNFEADQKLLDYIDKKVNRIDILADRIVSIDIFLKLEEKHSHIKDKTVEIKVALPGHKLFASDTNKVFKDAVDHTVGSIKKQLRKQKAKWAVK
ncbi:MAG: ribosome-associated translation inhibitor RaiA [Bacteroidetes bacterium]|nr:ribosome-associated translation inhibitor RaiA [Bacteroidota bacterium]